MLSQGNQLALPTLIMDNRHCGDEKRSGDVAVYKKKWAGLKPFSAMFVYKRHCGKLGDEYISGRSIAIFLGWALMMSFYDKTHWVESGHVTLPHTGVGDFLVGNVLTFLNRHAVFILVACEYSGVL